MARAIWQRFGKGTQGAGWHSFDQGGVHFIGLVNVVNLKAGGLGTLGDEQLEWLEKDVKRLKSSTPIVVFAHIPLWSVYPEWGWGTDDSERALSYLKRFGSVSVLNGHIHQVMQKVEGHVTFHTAMSTAFPQPAPGTAPSPGPMKVADDRLRKVLGLSRMSFHDVNHPIAITDVPLEAEMQTATAHDVVMDNFSFTPGDRIRAGRHDRHLDEPRRRAAQRRQHRAEVQVAGARYRRTVLASLRRARDVQVLLLDSPEDDRPDRGGVTQCDESLSDRSAWRSGRSRWR